MPPTLETFYSQELVGTASQFIPDISLEGWEVPALTIKPRFRPDIVSALNYSWEEEIADNFSFVKQNILVYQRAKILERLASDILEHSENLNPDFAKIINDNFWDLI